MLVKDATQVIVKDETLFGALLHLLVAVVDSALLGTWPRSTNKSARAPGAGTLAKHVRART